MKIYESPYDCSIEKLRVEFKADEYEYTAQELIIMRDFLGRLATIFYELYISTPKEELIKKFLE